MLGEGQCRFCEQYGGHLPSCETLQPRDTEAESSPAPEIRTALGRIALESLDKDLVEAIGDDDEFGDEIYLALAIQQNRWLSALSYAIDGIARIQRDRQ